MKRKILSFFLIVILSLSSIGLPVFSHVCNGLDKTWTSILIPPSNCCSSADTEKGNCDEQAKTDKGCQVTKVPCCENEVAYAALDSKYNSLSQPFVNLLLGPGLPGILLEITESYLELVPNVKFYSSLDFTHRYGRSLLIFEQLFLC